MQVQPPGIGQPRHGPQHCAGLPNRLLRAVPVGVDHKNTQGCRQLAHHIDRFRPSSRVNTEIAEKIGSGLDEIVFRERVMITPVAVEIHAEVLAGHRVELLGGEGFEVSGLETTLEPAILVF